MCSSILMNVSGAIRAKSIFTELGIPRLVDIKLKEKQVTNPLKNNKLMYIFSNFKIKRKVELIFDNPALANSNQSEG